MAGPACSVILSEHSKQTLQDLDVILAAFADRLERTRKGRVFDLWKEQRPYHVHFREEELTIELSAGCNGREDYRFLETLSEALATRLNGVASPPEK